MMIVGKDGLKWLFEVFVAGVLITCFDNILITIRKLIIKTGTIKLPLLFNPEAGLHVRDDRVAKLATFQ